MSESRHTPGPWRTNKSGYVYGPDCVVARCGDFSAKDLIEFSGDRWNADARLISAAPELLDGCNAILGLITLISGRDDISPEIREALTNSHRIDDARAAIRKATGDAL